MISKEIIRGFIDSIILELLTEGDSYGYEISKKIEEKTSGSFIMKEATLYAAIKRLEKKEFVTSYLGEKTHGRKRKYYKLSTIGITYLNEKKEEWKETKKTIELFLGGESK